MPDLPVGAMRAYPPSPGMWEGELNAREERLRELAAGGDAAASKALQELPGAVIGALGSDPGAVDNARILDWIAGRFPNAGAP